MKRVQAIKRAAAPSRVWCGLTIATCILHASTLHASGPADVYADNVAVDAKDKSLDVSGNVRIDAAPFHLRSDKLHLARSWRGLEITGEGRLSFCPCEGPPLTMVFQAAAVAPPGDLFLKHARLELYGVPVFYLPYFWLRSPGRLGVLPPLVEYRGSDGFALGGGVHLPWRAGDMRNGMDLRAGVYLQGGAFAETRILAGETRATVRWDYLAEHGLTVDLRGNSHSGADVRIELDAMRGERSVRATSSLTTASQRYDRARADVVLQNSAATFQAGVRAVGLRGGNGIDDVRSGPVLGGAFAWVLGPTVHASLNADAGALSGGDISVAGPQGATGVNAVSFVRSVADVDAYAYAGPLRFEARIRAEGRVLGGPSGANVDAAVTPALTLSAPLGRTFSSGVQGDPYRHTIEPYVRAALVLGTQNAVGRPLTSNLKEASVFGDQATHAVVMQMGLANALARLGGQNRAEVRLAAGAVATDGGAVPVVRMQIALESSMARIDGQLGLVAVDGKASQAATAAVRIGHESLVLVGARLSYQRGDYAERARLLVDAGTDPLLRWYPHDLFTGTASASFPLAPALRIAAGADYDFQQHTMLGMRGALEVRDRCKCVALRVYAGKRLGRDGVDAGIVIDFLRP